MLAGKEHETTMTKVDRRAFIERSGALAAMACFSSCLRTPSGAGERYSVAVLGDTHYDAEPESVYHSHYDESNRWAKIQHQEFKRNGEMWRTRCPGLLAASAALSHRMDTRFALQLGDIIQGDCDHVPTHKKMLDDCVTLFRAPYPRGLPFLTVMGNHDFRGKGAREAYMEFAERFMTDEIARLTGRPGEVEARYPVFSFRTGGDLWIFCDFETDNLQPVIDAVNGGTDARHVFLVTHGPFTASDSMSFRWRLGGKKCCEALRPKLYEALSRRRAVVLSGHTHTTAYFRHENEFGGFCEFTVNSVLAKPELATGEGVRTDVAGYGEVTAVQLKDGALNDFKTELGFFRPGLKEYFLGFGAGHYRLDVADDEVAIAFYPGDARSPARRFVLFGGKRHPAG